MTQRPELHSDVHGDPDAADEQPESGGGESGGGESGGGESGGGESGGGESGGGESGGGESGATAMAAEGQAMVVEREAVWELPVPEADPATDGWGRVDEEWSDDLDARQSTDGISPDPEQGHVGDPDPGDPGGEGRGSENGGEDFAGGGPGPVDPAPLQRGEELSLEHRAVEAVVLCAVEPVPVGLLAELLELAPTRVDQVCAELAADYRSQRRGFVLARVAGGYRYQTDPELAPFVERFAMEGVSSRLSSAALETLAIVAYKQPVSRAQVAALRGVNVDGVVRLLNQRGLIAEVGHAPGPGQPVLYGTTPSFLEKLGLDSLGELPAVEDLFPGPEVVEVLEARLRPDTDAG